MLIFKLVALFFFAISLTLLISSSTSDLVPSNSTINNAWASLGYPAFEKLSVASIKTLSIISMPAATMPPAIILDTQFPPSSIVGKPIKAAFTVWGFFFISTVISVITPNNPSEPEINPNKS